MTTEEIEKYYDDQIENTADSMEVMGLKMEKAKAVKEGKIPVVICTMEEGCENCGS